MKKPARPEIILASTSPSRKQLLARLGIAFEIKLQNRFALSHRHIPGLEQVEIFDGRRFKGKLHFLGAPTLFVNQIMSPIL